MATLNKIPYYLFQLEKYWFNGPQQRFAKDAGISASSFNRILHSKSQNPSYKDICCIVELIEKELGRKIDPREVYRS